MEIKPCPLCGSPAEVTTDARDFAAIECKNWRRCGLHLSHVQQRGSPLKTLARRWNKRADLPQSGGRDGTDAERRLALAEARRDTFYEALLAECRKQYTFSTNPELGKRIDALLGTTVSASGVQE